MSADVRSDIGPFSVLPEWVLHAAVSDRAVRLFALLGRYADRNGEAFPGRSTLAKTLRASVDTIDRAMRELVSIGAVAIDARYDDAGDRTTSLYRLRFAPPGVAAPMRLPGRTDAATGGRPPAATVAAPVRHRTIATGTIPIGTITNSSTHQAALNRFESIFWPKFPRKEAKKAAARAFVKLNPDDSLLAVMLEALDRQHPSNPSQLQYFPHAASWLNGERWTDKPAEQSSSARPGRTGPPPAGKYAATTMAAGPMERAS
jgi:hypothetical protein